MPGKLVPLTHFILSKQKKKEKGKKKNTSALVYNIKDLIHFGTFLLIFNEMTKFIQIDLMC